MGQSMTGRKKINTDVTSEAVEENIDFDIKCPDVDCKAMLRDHEVRIRKNEIALVDYQRLVDNVVKMAENSEETQRATISTLTDISQAVIRMDGKIDNLVQRDVDRGNHLEDVETNFKDFKTAYYANEDEMKIDPRKIAKKALENWLLKLLAGAGGLSVLKILLDYISTLPK
jgi:hypothetical protein